MNLRNIFTTALGCFTILAACGNDNDSNITPTPEPKPDQPTEEAKDVTLYVTNTSRTYDLTKSGLAFGTGSNMSPSTVTLNPATRLSGNGRFRCSHHRLYRLQPDADDTREPHEVSD